VTRALLVIAGLLTVAAWQQSPPPPPREALRRDLAEASVKAGPPHDSAIYGHVNHLGWVVRDLDAVTRAWRAFGVTSIQDAATLDIPMTHRKA
jgi:hypothetical protein